MKKKSDSHSALRQMADLRGSLSYVLQRLIPFRQPLARHRASGLRFRFRPREVVGRHILRYQTYEPAISEWLFKWLASLPGPGLFIDVGANIGWFSLHAARFASVSSVLAFEPDAGNHALLCENIERNALAARVLPVSCALGAACGMALLHRYRDTNPGRHSLVQAHGQGQSMVAVATLDDVLAHLGHHQTPIHAIKLDVEGYEPAVLVGATSVLQRANVVVIELSRSLSEGGGLDFDGMLTRLTSAGFIPHVWDQPGPVPSMDSLTIYPHQCTVVLTR